MTDLTDEVAKPNVIPRKEEQKKAEGNTLWIIGKQEVADLYATCQFIGDKLGVRWLKPEDKVDSGEYVPKTEEIVFADYEKFREPVFAFRRLDQIGSYASVIPVKGKTWATRNGFQTPPTGECRHNCKTAVPDHRSIRYCFVSGLPAINPPGLGKINDIIGNHIFNMLI